MKNVYRDRLAITGPVDKDFIRQYTAISDRVICLGHGLPQGLLSSYYRLIVDDENAEEFRHQPENVYVWCNADCYVRRNGLKGFSTGMFISEPSEAMLFEVHASAEEIEASNKLFAKIVGDSLDLSSREIYENVLKNYHIEGNDVVAYNRERMFHFE